MRRDLVERKILGLLQKKLYCREAIDILVQKVNERLQQRRPELAAERERLLCDRAVVLRRLQGLRQFIEQGDTSASVREWLTTAEWEESRISGRSTELESENRKAPIRVHPDRVAAYLRHIPEVLSGIPLSNPLKKEAILRARALLREDIERVVIHPIPAETGKPFARAEVLTTGKGLLGRVAFVVAGARNHLQANWSVAFRFQIRA